MTHPALHITASASLRNGVFYRNGEPFSPAEFERGVPDWYKEIYRFLEMNYPKFHKMDTLSKLAVLCTEVLFSGEEIDLQNRDSVGLLFYNKHSSIDADIEHQKAIQGEDGLASPAVFVYTLPNIMLGEIAIRHRITGENMCLVTSEFSAQEAIEQCELMFAAGMKKVVLGWVDASQGALKAWMVLVEKDGNTPNISQLSTSYLNKLDKIPVWKH